MTMPGINRLALGTAQFGMAYGVANRAGQVSRDVAAGMLDYAWSRGVDTLDTAMVYGDSESRLGEIGVSRWRVISKLPTMPAGTKDVSAWVTESVRNSLARLRLPALYGVLLHHSADLLDDAGPAIYEALLKLKEYGCISRIGVSIYDPEELDVLCDRYKLDLVQAPLNIVDRRIASSGWLRKLKELGVEVHARSIFLQGLLLMGPSERPAAFGKWERLWREWHSWLTEQQVSSLTACLSFVMSHPDIDRVVVGSDTKQQLVEIVEASLAAVALPPASMCCEDLNLINPSRWNLH